MPDKVDHIDGDFRNDDVDNLQVLSTVENCKKYYVDAEKHRLEENFICPVCNTRFILSVKRLFDATQNRKKGKAGPFCGKSCAGKYSTGVQYHNKKPLPIVPVSVRYGA